MHIIQWHQLSSTKVAALHSFLKWQAFTKNVSHVRLVTKVTQGMSLTQGLCLGRFIAFGVQVTTLGLPGT